MGKLDRMISFLLPEITAQLGNTSKICRDWSSCIKKGDVNIGRAPSVVEEEGYFFCWSKSPLLAKSEYLITTDVVAKDSETAMRAMKEVITILIQTVMASWTLRVLWK